MKHVILKFQQLTFFYILLAIFRTVCLPEEIDSGTPKVIECYKSIISYFLKKKKRVKKRNWFMLSIFEDLWLV